VGIEYPQSFDSDSVYYKIDIIDIPIDRDNAQFIGTPNITAAIPVPRCEIDLPIQI